MRAPASSILLNSAAKVTVPTRIKRQLMETGTSFPDSTFTQETKSFSKFDWTNQFQRSEINLVQLQFVSKIFPSWCIYYSLLIPAP